MVNGRDSYRGGGMRPGRGGCYEILLAKSSGPALAVKVVSPAVEKDYYIDRQHG